LLVKTWEAVFQNKILVSDRVLLSPGRQVVIDLMKSLSGLQKTITYLPIILFREFEENNHLYTLKSASGATFQPERLRRYRSPIVLNSIIQTADKFEAILAVD
jgi:hypothetical protein